MQLESGGLDYWVGGVVVIHPTLTYALQAYVVRSVCVVSKIHHPDAIPGKPSVQ
jgi:hypothetical protein